MSEKYLTLAEALNQDMEAAGLIVVPRDQHELYKEAAEKWAQIQVAPRSGCWSCARGEASPIHAADCKAARILGLPMEGV